MNMRTVLVIALLSACGSDDGNDQGGSSGAMAPPPQCGAADRCTLCGLDTPSAIFAYRLADDDAECVVLVGTNPALQGRATGLNPPPCMAGGFAFTPQGGSVRVQNSNTGETVTLPCTTNETGE